MTSFPFHHIYVTTGLIICLICLLFYIYDLKKKVKQQNDVMQRLHLQERTQLSQLEQKDAQELNKEELLFVKVSKYMEEEKPFTDHDFKVEDLAAAMSTNRTYLANAIKTYANRLTTQQYINRFRVRYAASLLQAYPEKSINEISEEAGFSSRSTFNRQFFLLFGYTPSECRSSSSRQRSGDLPTMRENTLEK